VLAVIMTNDTKVVQPTRAQMPTVRTVDLAGPWSTGDVRAVAVITDRPADRGRVCAHLDTNVLVSKGAFPGANAWSPPT
jgi:hypothetical protein